MKSRIMFTAALSLMSMQSLSFAQTNPEIQDLVRFLTSDVLLVKSKDAQKIPLSYYLGDSEDISKYFGDYICAKDQTCSVVDALYSAPYAILGQKLAQSINDQQSVREAQAQIERTDMKYGTNLYDSATWQIALALASKNGYLPKDKALKLVDNELKSVMNPKNRATNAQLKYGYQKPITDPEQAFSYRMVATDFHNKDPFYQTSYQDQVRWNYDPEVISANDPEHHSPDFFKYVSTWSDWKPILGENAWANIIGPLQAEYILNGKIANNSTGLINAMKSLRAFSSMQSGIGGFYYAPENTLGNEGPIERGEISLENNFSMLGALQILKKSLQEVEQTSEVVEALGRVDVMLYGGNTVNGNKTLGLLSFLYHDAYNEKQGVFYTHGTAPDPLSTKEWHPDTSDSGASMAVDINTWGVSALGAETIDRWYGEKTALNLWKQVKMKGGYFHQGKLWGVGYTLKNNQGANGDQVMSAEWTAGAISMVQSLIDYYDTQGVDTSELSADLESMREGIKHLRTDAYLDSGFEEAVPASNYVTLPPGAGQAYLYASKRFHIPFGWHANPLPSTASTTWVIMNHFNYNPFQYAGKLSGENYDVPPEKDMIID